MKVYTGVFPSHSGQLGTLISRKDRLFLEHIYIYHSNTNLQNLEYYVAEVSYFSSILALYGNKVSGTHNISNVKEFMELV